MEFLNDGMDLAKPKATFTLDKKNSFLFMNGLRVCDFLMDMLRTWPNW
jgi:hypothetical protein